MLSVVGAALDVSLDIFSNGEESFPPHDYTQKPAVLRGSRTHTAVPLHDFALLHPQIRGGGGIPEIRRNNNNIHLPRTNTKNDFPRRHGGKGMIQRIPGSLRRITTQHLDHGIYDLDVPP